MNVINESLPGGRIGQSLGTGLSKSLDMLTNHKLGQIAERNQLQLQASQRQQESGALEALGVPSHISNAIVNIADPNLKKTILSNLGGLGGNAQGMEQSQGLNLFQNPADKFKQQQLELSRNAQERKASEFQTMEARRAAESQAKLGEIAAKTGLTTAKTIDIAENRALQKKNQKLREDIAKVNERISKEKNDIARQRLEDQRNKMESLITINTNNIEKLEAAKQKQTLAQQKAIDSKLKPYRANLDKRYNASESIVSKANQMLNLLNNGEVNSGIEGKFKPLFLSNDATNEFSGLADDIANELTALSTGQQTISKIKFNQQRKPNVAQSNATQIERTQDLIKEANKVILENDLANYFIDSNNGENPKDLQQRVQGLIKKIGEPPLKSSDDKDGDILRDPKTGIEWIVSGPILRFNGLIGKV